MENILKILTPQAYLQEPGTGPHNQPDQFSRRPRALSLTAHCNNLVF